MGEQIDVTESWCSGGGGSAELTGRAVAAADERSLSSWISSLISLNWELKGVMSAEEIKLEVERTLANPSDPIAALRSVLALLEKNPASNTTSLDSQCLDEAKRMVRRLGGNPWPFGGGKEPPQSRT